jgi:hypothetical protein
MKRTELKRKTPMRAKAKPKNHDYVVDNGFVSGATLQPLAKLPPIPTSLAKAARKVSRPKTTKARQAAKGKPCMMRIPGVCSGDISTVVLCHYRLAGYCGTGIKPNDVTFGAWACDQCHAAADGRLKTEHTHTQLRLWHCEAILRTQEAIRTGEIYD